MKIASSLFFALFSLSVSGQSIQLENLVYDKKESKIIFDIEQNIFRVVSEKNVLNIEYDKRLAEAVLKGDSLLISPHYNKSLQKYWQEKGNAFNVSFLTQGGKQDITFIFRKLTHSVPALTPRLGDSNVDRDSVLAFGKIIIMPAGSDPEEFFKNYKVKRFEILLNDKSFLVEGEELSQEVLAAIAAAKVGDRITLQRVESFNNNSNQKLMHVGKAIYILR